MKEQKKKKPARWGMAFSAVMYALLGFVCYSMLAGYQRQHPAHEYGMLLLVLGVLYAAIFLHILIHEAGHLVFGLLSGYKFSSFRIFSLMWVREEDGLRLRRLSLAGTAGQCLMAPPDLQDGQMPVVLYNLGGCLMNVLTGLLAWALSLAMASHPLLQVFFRLFAVVGFFLAVMNGLPLPLGPVDNDGRNAFFLKKDPAALRAFWIQMKVADLQTRGVRLRDMPAEWFALPSPEEMQNGLAATLGVFSCGRLMDEGRIEEADKQTEALLAADTAIAELHRRLLLCDRLFAELVGENRPEIVSGFLDEAQKKFLRRMRDYPSVRRTEYVLALLRDRDEAKAASIREQFEKRAASYPYQNDVASERELMDLAAAKFREGG